MVTFKSMAAFAATLIALASAKNVNRPQLLPYVPTAAQGAAVLASDKMARFTVLTDELIRMEYAKMSGIFEDRASLAVLNRELPVPKFSQQESNGVLTITTAKVTLTYKLNKGFTADSLKVTPVGQGTFPGWYYGQPNPGNLLGTLRGQDQQSATPLNCTVNKGVHDNGEFNHCEWGLVSRDGWVVYNDSLNAYTDENDWWSDKGPPPTPAPPAPPRNCSAPPLAQTDAKHPTNVHGLPSGGKSSTNALACCNDCVADKECVSYVFDHISSACWLLSSDDGHVGATDRTYGRVAGAVDPIPSGPQFSLVAEDLYGFFHGLNYTSALHEYSMIGGKAIMIPKNAMGVWWTRWFDMNNYDTKKIVDDYESRDIPLDIFVIDMDWHTKDDWSGFTFDSHLFPSAEDSMEYLNAKGLTIALNLHDASGVNYWDAMFPALVQELGLPSSTKKVPMNLLNSTVAYAVEDIVLGDLINNKHIGFWWIDWQQGGSQGGMTGNKQNPTIWLAHLRCTDRHRVGDDKRAMVLARWGGMGHHRYQVGFSGDVAALTWANLAYQPYYSATAANVLFPAWSHDIEGPAADLEMYTRWLQVGAFSGTMRSHERGMSAGGCANKHTAVSPSIWGPDSGSCSIVAPWNVGPQFFGANRRALQSRERLLPYIYTMHRQLFDVGVGIVQPLYYKFPSQDEAYRMNATSNAQYFFGDDIMVAPVTAPAGANGDILNHTASKQVWMPPGTWYDALTGKVSTATSTGMLYSRGYTLGEVPMWMRSGSIIPYLPLKSLKSMVGVAAKQWDHLGFKIVPGSAAASGQVYEDDGATTAYLGGQSHVFTSVTATISDATTTVNIVSTPANNTWYSTFPSKRTYQIRLPNAAPPSKVTVGDVEVAYNKFGAVASSRTAPPTSQWYYAFEEDEGLGPVIDLVDVDTSKPLTVTITYGPNSKSITTAMNEGLYGTLMRSVYAHTNMDLDRSNPDSNSPGPAYLSQLSAVGVHLEYLATGANMDGDFMQAVSTVPALYANATAELQKCKSVRVPYTMDLMTPF